MTNADWTTFPLLNPVVVQYYSMYGNRSDPRRCLKMRVMEGTHGGGDGRCRRRQYEGRRKARNGCSCNASHQFAARKVARAPERDSSSGRGTRVPATLPVHTGDTRWQPQRRRRARARAGGRTDGRHINMNYSLRPRQFVRKQFYGGTRHQAAAANAPLQYCSVYRYILIVE